MSSRAVGWPADLREGAVRLRPMRLRDSRAWIDVRRRNNAWLAPWEATSPRSPTRTPELSGGAGYRAMLGGLRQQARTGTAMPFALLVEGRLAGQVTVGTIVRGSLGSAHVGYWIDEAVAGRGLMPVALALVVDHCFGAGELHRIEANIRPENAASRRVVEKLGFREEGLRRRFLHIDGAWRDHLSYALTFEDVPGGLLARLLAAGGAPR